MTSVKAKLSRFLHSCSMTSARAADLRDKVRFLSDPAAYGPAVREVEARETHMSWVFLAGERVYKLKKPNKLPFLDFSTMRRRRFFCEEEARLNRRLAAETYLGVRRLSRAAGGYNLQGVGRTVDWLVEMRRLSPQDMLDRRVLDGRVEADEIAAVAARMADFYRSLTPQTADGHLYVDHLREEQEINRAMLLLPEFGLAEAAEAVIGETEAAMEACIAEVEARIAAGRIVEGHGDLRPEHVWLGEPLQVIDCLEFSRPMRILDPYDEVNYLGMECDVLGTGWIRHVLLATLSDRLGDPPSRRLLGAYGAFRALLRARISIVHLLERPVRKPEKWRPQTLRYLEQARRELVSSRCRAAPRSNRRGAAG